MESRISTHLSVQRAIAVLRSFSEVEPALTVSEISRRLNLHKSTVSRILGVLADEGLVWHNPENGRYSLGMDLVEMAGVALGQIDVRAAALPHIEQLAGQTRETVTLVVRRGRDAVTVAHVPSIQPVRHVAWIGRRLPLPTTAAGKVLLASLHSAGADWRSLAGVPAQDRPAEFEPALAEQLETISRQGYALESDEFEVGVSAIAAPVVGQDGSAVAAIAISGPADRFDLDARRGVVPKLIAAAEAVAADLGVRRWAAAGVSP